MRGIANSTDERSGIFFEDPKSVARTLMRSRLLPLIVLAGIVYVSTAPVAAAVPVPTASVTAVVSPSNGVSETAYYYRGRSYPYRYHGMYFSRRYYRYGRWHYY
jgi:hypothetical protein